MNFDYILDTFKKIFRTSDKYQKIEKEAIRLIQKYYRGTIPDNRFYTQMLELQSRLFYMNPDNVIDEGYPLWLNRFLGFAFHDWCTWFRFRTLYAEHPEKFTSPQEENSYQKLLACNHDGIFREYCRRYLEELDVLA